MSFLRPFAVAIAAGVVRAKCGGFPNAEQAQTWQKFFVQEEPVPPTKAEMIKKEIAYCEKRIVQGLVVEGHESVYCLTSDHEEWNDVEEAVIKHFVEMGYVCNKSVSYDGGHEYRGSFSLPKKRACAE